MNMKGKRELPRGSVSENETPNYPMVSRGNHEEDRLDTERRLEERRQQRALAESQMEAAAEPQAEEAAEFVDRAGRTKKILIAVCVLLGVALAGLLAYKALFVKPDVEKKPVPKPDGEQTELIEEEQIDVGEGLQPVISGERKSEDFYTFLIL